METCENALGAGNQQGRLGQDLAHYICGFVDGEGSFHVAVQKNPTTTYKWQLIPEFHVSQHQRNVSVLNLIQSSFGCGYVKPNHHNSERDVTWVFVVRSRTDLINKIIPFFEKFPLRTSKQEEFKKFSSIVMGLENGKHKEKSGLIELLKLAFSMNREGRYRKISLEKIIQDLEPSETVRQTALF